MVGLMVITGVMVTITMMAAIITAREVEALKTEVNNLEAIQEEENRPAKRPPIRVSFDRGPNVYRKRIERLIAAERSAT